MKLSELTPEDKEQIRSFDCLTPPDTIFCHTCPMALLKKEYKGETNPSMVTLLSDCLVFEALSGWKKPLDPDFDVDMPKLMAIKNKQYGGKADDEVINYRV